MSSQLLISLELTLIGMGLVFSAILLLWGGMALLVRLTADKSAGKTNNEEIDQAAELERKQKAAAAAVMVALARAEAEETPLKEFPLPPAPLVSAWQAVMRSRMLHKRGQIK